MRRHDANSVGGNIVCADDKCRQTLAAVIEIALIPCLERFAPDKGLEPLCFQGFNGVSDRLALGLGAVEEDLVPLGIVEHPADAGSIGLFIAVFLFVSQLLHEELPLRFGLFFHI